MPALPDSPVAWLWQDVGWTSRSWKEAATYNPNRSYTIDITGHGKKAADHVGATKRFDQELIRFRGLKYALSAWTNLAPNKKQQSRL